MGFDALLASVFVKPRAPPCGEGPMRSCRFDIYIFFFLDGSAFKCIRTLWVGGQLTSITSQLLDMWWLQRPFDCSELMAFNLFVGGWFQSDCGCKVMDMVSNTQVGTRCVAVWWKPSCVVSTSAIRLVTGVFPLRLDPSSACRRYSSKADRRSTDVCYAFRIPRYIGFTFSIDHVVVVVVLFFLFFTKHFSRTQSRFLI